MLKKRTRLHASNRTLKNYQAGSLENWRSRSSNVLLNSLYLPAWCLPSTTKNANLGATGKYKCSHHTFHKSSRIVWESTMDFFWDNILLQFASPFNLGIQNLHLTRKSFFWYQLQLRPALSTLNNQQIMSICKQEVYSSFYKMIPSHYF